MNAFRIFVIVNFNKVKGARLTHEVAAIPNRTLHELGVRIEPHTLKYV
jgi:hypothetical protein